MSLTKPFVALAAVIGVLLAPLGGETAASGSGAASTSTIGGLLLARSGTVVHPASGAPALPKGITAHSWLVADMNTGQVLAARGAHEKYLPASTLKTLTALTLLPKLDPHRMFAATYRDAAEDGTRVGLVPGHKYSIGSLFRAMLMVSANDAADALAQANGGFAKTLREMNARAAELQADDTHAITPSGLDGTAETISAYDLALIARAAMRMPAFRRYVQTVSSEMPAPHHRHYQIYTHNYLLTTYHGDLGGKNGYTVAANATYWTVARRDGHTILITLMDANPDFWPDARALLGWGFRADGKVQPVGQLVAPLATATSVPVSPVAADVSGTTPATRGGGRGSGWDVEVGVLIASALVLLATLARRRSRRARRSWGL
jgi:D-alanyl-D-alanine carboxypeptidase (penicillin-binding protein 5/6)